MNTPILNQLYWLVKREYWENRGGFLRAPLVTGGIFLLLNLAPGDPLANQPLTIPPEVRQKMREALGLGAPIYVRYVLWLKAFFWVEPLHAFDWAFGTHFSAGMQRILSWQFRSPVFDVIVQRLPQTLKVVGLSYLIGVLIAIPIGIVSAYRQYSIFDQVGTE